MKLEHTWDKDQVKSDIKKYEHIKEYYTDWDQIPMLGKLYLLNDEYDHLDLENAISATTFMKSPRAMVATMRKVSPSSKALGSFVKMRRGTDTHDKIEKICMDKDAFYNTMVKQGEDPNAHEIIMEERYAKTYRGYTIHGKFDIIHNNQLVDVKTTSTWSYTSGLMDMKYRIQCSIYKWLNPEMIKGDTFKILMIFGDWRKATNSSDLAYRDYPIAPIVELELEYLSEEELKAFIDSRLDLLDLYKNTPLEQIPCCEHDREDQWLGAKAIYKYYGITKQGVESKVAKNFGSISEATAFMMEKGNVGRIETQYVGVFPCDYCDK